MLASARDGELGQVDVEARRVDARGEVLAHLGRHGSGVLATLQLREVVLVADLCEPAVSGPRVVEI